MFRSLLFLVQCKMDLTTVCNITWLSAHQCHLCKCHLQKSEICHIFNWLSVTCTKGAAHLAQCMAMALIQVTSWTEQVLLVCMCIPCRHGRCHNRPLHILSVWTRIHCTHMVSIYLKDMPSLQKWPLLDTASIPDHPAPYDIKTQWIPCLALTLDLRPWPIFRASCQKIKVMGQTCSSVRVMADGQTDATKPIISTTALLIKKIKWNKSWLNNTLLTYCLGISAWIYESQQYE